MQCLTIVNRQCPGDLVCLSAIIRDLSSDYLTAIDVPHELRSIFDNNPWIVPTAKGVRRIEVNDCGSLRKDNQFHIIEAMADYAGKQLGHQVNITALKGDLYLSEAELERPQLPSGYWIVAGGGKREITTKLYPWFRRACELVDVPWVQIGRSSDYHPVIPSAINLLDQTSVRDVIRLIYHAAGVLTPISFPLHVAAAFAKPCVVVAGASEKPAHYSYPGQTIIHAIGRLPCCADRHCLRLYLDKDESATNCPHFRTINGENFAECQIITTPEEVAAAVVNRLCDVKLTNSFISSSQP